jgi:hypothetical protein
MSFLAAHLYLKHYEGESKISASELWRMLFALLGLFLASVLVFVVLMDRRYLKTFVTTATGPQSTVDKFKSSTTDEQRLNTFKYHDVYYAAIEEELKALLAENWDDWMLVRPEWLTEGVVACIPDKFLPEKEVERLNILGGGKRRRSSFSGVGAG